MDGEQCKRESNFPAMVLNWLQAYNVIGKNSASYHNATMKEMSAVGRLRGAARGQLA